MPHRRKAAKSSSVRLRAHRIPPTVLSDTVSSRTDSPLPVMSPAASGIIPAAPAASRTRPARAPMSVFSSSTPWIWVAIAVVALLTLLAVGALNPFATPATEQAYSANVSDSAQSPGSTPVAIWKKGAVPRLYSGDEQWANMAYGASTVGLAGAAPTTIAMVYVYETGATDTTPATVARWANEHNAASTSPEAIESILTDGAAQFGLDASTIEMSAIAIRQALANGKPVVAVLEQGTTGPVESTIVLCAIDQESRLVVNDPTSVENTTRTWSFDEVLNSAKELYTYTLA